MTHFQETTIKTLKEKAEDARRLANILELRAADIGKNSVVSGPDSELLTWAINDIENFIMNIHFASLARLVGRLKIEGS